MKDLLDNTLFKWLAWFCNHRHNLLMIYCVVFLFLIFGVINDSGIQYLSLLLLYLTVFLLTYFFADKFIRRSSAIRKIISIATSKIELGKLDLVSIVLLVVTILFMLVHFFYLGGVPTVQAWQSHNSFDIYIIRKIATTQSPSFINYPHSFILKAIIPFLLLFFYQKEYNKIFIVLFFISFFYCTAFIAKSYLVTALIPLLLFVFFKKKYFQFICISLLIFCGLNFLVFVSNPALRGGDSNQLPIIEIPSQSGDELTSSLNGLTTRTFLVPGAIVSKWFRFIPDSKPFLNGKGYHFISIILRTEFKNYTSELYPLIYPGYAKRGYAGTVNTASFMYDYSNFGWIGIIYSAIILAIVFVFVNLIFEDNNFIKICVNLYYVLALSSSSLLTLAFSGGWGLMILLFLIFRKDFTSNKNTL